MDDVGSEMQFGTYFIRKFAIERADECLLPEDWIMLYGVRQQFHGRSHSVGA
jgi:hypothetical protein